MSTATEGGLYTPGEAARLTHVPSRTVIRWSRLGIATADRSLLFFEDLITLLTVRELRKAGVAIEDIKGAERHLASTWGIERPFAHARIRTGYRAIITVLAQGDHPVAVTAAVQEIFLSLIDKDLHDVSFAANEYARLWRPAQFVALRPDLQWGQPCIEGTRITTRTVHQFMAGGQTVHDLVEDFGITPEQVSAAFNYEETLLTRAA